MNIASRPPNAHWHFYTHLFNKTKQTIRFILAFVNAVYLVCVPAGEMPSLKSPKYVLIFLNGKIFVPIGFYGKQPIKTRTPVGRRERERWVNKKAPWVGCWDLRSQDLIGGERT